MVAFFSFSCLLSLEHTPKPFHFPLSLDSNIHRDTIFHPFHFHFLSFSPPEPIFSPFLPNFTILSPQHWLLSVFPTYFSCRLKQDLDLELVTMQKQVENDVQIPEEGISQVLRTEGKWPCWANYLPFKILAPSFQLERRWYNVLLQAVKVWDGGKGIGWSYFMNCSFLCGRLLK